MAGSMNAGARLERAWVQPRVLPRRAMEGGGTTMTSDFRRRWQAVLAALLIWGGANLIGSAGQAADDAPAPAGAVEAQAISERLDAMVERAAATLRGRQGGEGEQIEPDADAATLRARLEEAETQIRLLKNVVIQALRAQSAAEEALRREQS